LHKYRNRYAVAGFCLGISYVGLILALNYFISSQTPGQMFEDLPAAAILSYLIIPLSFLVGYLWGAERDQRSSVRMLTQRQQEHVDMAENLSTLLRQGEESRRMTAIAVQEMKHPLTSIVGYTLTLREYWDRLDEESRHEFVDFIKVSASRLEGIANDMLRITELTKIAPRVEKEQLKLEEILQEARHILEEIHAERQVKIGVRFTEEFPPLIGDPSRLFDLLYNLLDICMRCSENKRIVSAWCSIKDEAVQMRLR
jgi:signal transduction histidine kinase